MPNPWIGLVLLATMFLPLFTEIAWNTYKSYRNIGKQIEFDVDGWKFVFYKEGNFTENYWHFQVSRATRPWGMKDLFDEQVAKRRKNSYD